MPAAISKTQLITGSNYSKYVRNLFEQAQHSISVAVFDWRWYKYDPASPMQLLNQSLLHASRRGCNVRAFTSSRDIANLLISLGIKAKSHQHRSLFHPKLVIIDAKHVVIGSHNWSNSAMEKNVEASVHIQDEQLATQSLLYFEQIWQS